MQPGKPWNSNRTQNRKGVEVRKGVRKGVRVKIQYCIFTLTPFLTPFLTSTPFLFCVRLLFQGFPGCIGLLQLAL